MKMQQKNIRMGFTLVELIVVVAILAVLALLIVPKVTDYTAQAQAVTCRSNRRTLVTEMDAAAVSDVSGNPLTASQNALKVHGKNVSCGANGTCTVTGICPSGGNYIVSFQADGTVSSVVCSKHSDTESGSSGGQTGSTYLDTNIAISASSAWPAASDYQDNLYKTIIVKAGTVISWSDGKTYIVVKDIELNKKQALSGPGGDAYNWFATDALTKKVYTAADFTNQRSDMVRGDLYKDSSGQYYVYIDGGTWASRPEKSVTQWYKIVQP